MAFKIEKEDGIFSTSTGIAIRKGETSIPTLDDTCKIGWCTKIGQRTKNYQCKSIVLQLSHKYCIDTKLLDYIDCIKGS